jgi:hypothetical protein
MHLVCLEVNLTSCASNAEDLTLRKVRVYLLSVVQCGLSPGKTVPKTQALSRPAPEQMGLWRESGIGGRVRIAKRVGARGGITMTGTIDRRTTADTSATDSGTTDMADAVIDTHPKTGMVETETAGEMAVEMMTTDGTRRETGMMPADGLGHLDEKGGEDKTRGGTIAGEEKLLSSTIVVRNGGDSTSPLVSSRHTLLSHVSIVFILHSLYRQASMGSIALRWHERTMVCQTCSVHAYCFNL